MSTEVCNPLQRVDGIRSLYYQNEQHWIVEQAFTSGKGWYM